MHLLTGGVHPCQSKLYQLLRREGYQYSMQTSCGACGYMQRARKAASMMTQPCLLIMVRHGETAWNKEGRLQGQQEPGPPLDELGLQQAAVVSTQQHNQHSFC